MIPDNPDPNRSFRIEIWPSIERKEFQDMEIVLLQLTLNGKPGRGILMRKSGHSFPTSRFSSIMDTTIMSPLDNFEKAESAFLNCLQVGAKWKKIPEIVSFEAKLALDVSVVGGKGASLAQLCHLSQNSEEVCPRGP